MDRLSKEHRSWNMSRIRSKNTKPEMRVRLLLHRMGYRYRIHVRTLAGCPDIVIRKAQTVIFVHGCFWHRHKGCKFAYSPKSRLKFWNDKFNDNVARDIRHRAELKKSGWHVRVIWECEVDNELRLTKKLARFLGER